MEDTGRIREPLDRRARGLVFAETGDAAIEQEIAFYTEIDRAHVVMLAERRLVPRACACRVIAAIDELRAAGYAPLRGRPALRGSYLLYERWLIDTLGEQAGGSVHLGRSRNDINATVFRLRLRPVYRRVMREVLRLIAVLTRHAGRHAALVMPIYTHYQAAVPISFGHYLAGIAQALLRDVRAVEAAAHDLECCPLGAGAAGGTDIPIDTARTARLLGFGDVVRHSIDAVASRDLALRLLGAASVLGVTLSRLAMDLQLWSMAELDFIRFPDSLVGSSSMMPQKRNAFLLEHVKGRAAAPLGAFTAATMAMHATPFSNSIAVGTEGVAPLWHAMEEVTGAVVLARLMVAGAEPQPDRMRQRAADGFTSATALANHLVLASSNGGATPAGASRHAEPSLSFRQAHYRVGEAIRDASSRGESLEHAAAALLREHDLPEDAAGLDPEAVAARSAFGGGPAPEVLARLLGDLRRDGVRAARALHERAHVWLAGRRALEAAAATLLEQSERRERCHA